MRLMPSDLIALGGIDHRHFRLADHVLSLSRLEPDDRGPAAPAYLASVEFIVHEVAPFPVPVASSRSSFSHEINTTPDVPRSNVSVCDPP